MTAILKASFTVTCIAFPLLLVAQATRYWGKGEQYILVRKHFYLPQTKLQEGNVFTPVCQSFVLGGLGGVYPSM